MVMFGIHNGIAPLGPIQMADLGYDSIWGPGNIVSNMAQAAAGLVVALRSKKDRKVAMPGAITAFMGITEPILYGTNLPKKYPLVAAMIGGACGGLYAGLTQAHRFATGSGGLPAVLLYIGDGTMQHLINIIIAMVIAAGISAALTFVLYGHFEKDDEPAAEKDELTEPAAPAAPAAPVLANGTLVAPIAGKVLPMESCSDPIFAGKGMGDGCVVVPADGTLVSPCDGTVSLVADTGHAVGLVSDQGAEILIHIGIDTVNLAGKPFAAYVKPGDRVGAGQPLMDVDLEQIKAAGLSTETMVIVTNTPDFSAVSTTASGAVAAGDELLDLTV